MTVVCDRGERFVVESDRGEISARGIINATGTWERPFIPDIPGAEKFRGRTLHTKDYHTAADFIGKHVIIVGAGISAIQLLDEISRVTTTTWATRRPPELKGKEAVILASWEARSQGGEDRLRELPAHRGRPRPTPPPHHV